MQPLHRYSLVFAGVVAALAWSQSAFATSSIVISTTITRSNSSHPNGLVPYQISRGDCLNNDVLSIPLTISYDPALTLEAWVGTGADCTDASVRIGGSSPSCSRVYTAAQSTTTPTIALRVQDLMAGINQPGTDITTSPGTAGDCNPSNQTNPLPQPLNTYFMFLSGSTVDSFQVLKTSYSLLGPAAPTGISIGPGDTFLKLTWDTAASGTVAGYYFFCDPLPGHEGFQVSDGGASAGNGAGAGGGSSCDASLGDDAGDSSDEGDATDDAACTPASSTGGGGSGGSGGSGGTSSICSSETLVEGTVPDNVFLTANLCGQADGGTANSGTVGGLANNDIYAVSIAPFDSLGNVGSLSAPQCQIPRPVDDFNTVYRRLGGTAGGSSFCSVSKVERGDTGRTAGVAMLVLAFAWLGARRPGRSIPRKKS